MSNHRHRGPTRGLKPKGAEPPILGDLRSERVARDAIVMACATLLRRIKAEHPEIVRHLQSLPDAQITVDEAKAFD